jgi:hypothetical protein
VISFNVASDHSPSVGSEVDSSQAYTC